MNIQEFALLLMSVLASVGGQFFLKAGALKLGRVHLGNAVSHIFSIITTPELVLGLACYGLGALAYIMLLTRVSLSIAGPSISLSLCFLSLVRLLHFQGNSSHNPSHRFEFYSGWSDFGNLAKIKLILI